MAIYFYRERDLPYGCFSNFAKYPIEIDGVVWRTVEHYFQAQKFTDQEVIARILAVKSPMEAKIIGNDRTIPMRSDWETVKDDIMRKAVLAKFEQHEDIRKILLSTIDKNLP